MLILENTNPINLAEEYYFVKSMNKVRTVEALEFDNWIVERVDTGKQLFVNAKSLFKEEYLEEIGIYLEKNS